jgi:hypothetical protein
MANANRNSRDRGGVRQINISPRTAPASGNRSSIKLVTCPCHYGNGKVGEGAVPNPLRFSHDTFARAIYLGLRNGSCTTRGDQWPDERLWKRRLND